MGETVGGKSPEVSRVFSKDPLVNLEHFDTNLMGAVESTVLTAVMKNSLSIVRVSWQNFGI